MKNNPYILPSNVKPIKYEIELTPNMKDFTFKGKEKIEIYIAKKTNKIIINSKDILIKSVSIEQEGKKTKSKKISYQKNTEMATFNFSKTINEGKANLSIEFESTLREDMSGFYKSNYSVDGKNEVMATTQFEPNSARKAFPCFDEPALKAIFKISLIIPKELQAISNMPVEYQESIGKKRIVVFEDSPIMSSYLVAFIVGKFEMIQSKTRNGTDIRVFTTPGKKERGKFALEVGIKSLEFYEKYFEINYPLPKLDMVAIPDFAAGAMENWGIVTFREAMLLVDEKNSSTSTKQSVAVVIAHELAHQWFGNLVTMKWWNDLWLNEGFASWIEYMATDKIFPEWDIWSQFLYQDVQRAMTLDGLNNSHPIEVNVSNPGEIDEIFDAISYSKGASVIRMIAEYMGLETLGKGLKNYLKKFSYGNTCTDDLWKCLEEASGKPIGDIAKSWTQQKGYPLIYASYNGKLNLRQKRFFYSGEKKSDKTLWKIPIAIEQNKKISYHFMEDETSSVDIKPGKIILNPSEVGFYRICYDRTMTEEIFQMLKDKSLKSLDRLNLINNIFSMTYANYTNIEIFLETVKNYKYEDDFNVWSDLASDLGQTRILFSDSEHIEKFRKFCRDIYSEIVKKIGWDPKINENHSEKLLRPLVLFGSGLNGNEEIINEAKKRFEEYLKNGNLNPDIRGVVYNLVAANGDRETYNKLKELYLKADLQEEKVRLLRSLGYFKKEDILQDVLKFNLSKDVRPQDTITGVAYVSANTKGKYLAWNFLKNNWKEFKKRYSGKTYVLSRLISAIGSTLNTLEDSEDFRKFFKKNPVSDAKMTINQTIETIKNNHKFVKQNKKNFEKWLNSNF